MRLASVVLLAICAVVMSSKAQAGPDPAESVHQPGESQKATDIWVFEPFTSQSEKELKAGLSQAFPGVHLSIFTRFRDFRKALGKNLPDAILTRPLVLEAFPSIPLVIQFQGSQSGSSMEPFAFIANKPLGGKEEMILGAVDIKGRKETSAWLEEALPEKTVRLKAVSRMEDLMSLLLFDYVDAIVVPTRDIQWFQDKTEKPLLIQDHQFKVGLPVIATLPQVDHQQLIQALQKVKIDDQGMGVDKWVKPSQNTAFE